MIPVHQITELLHGLEAEIHEDGWNQDALLGQLIQEPSGELRVRQLPLPDADHHPVNYLKFLAETLIEQPHFAKAVADDNPEMLGLLFCNESWISSGKTTKRDGYFYTPMRVGSRFGDRVGSTPTRIIALIDVWGRPIFWCANAVRAR